ncbi:MAG: homoserine O-acetyltransferase [Cyanobacteria bacterium Co-bin13]|nr:homoserine O-acetyltransferase [Cyanobacteria bacterium Co-bin13]
MTSSSPFQQFISSQTRVFTLPEPFCLESGVALTGVQVAYRTWGKLNDQRTNAILVCHALTGWADVDDWWEPLLGPGRALDPERDFIVCSNILGSCYGTTGPTSINPQTGRAYGPTFPAITVRDMVHLQAALLRGLGIASLQMVIGGSLGGMQVLEWTLLYPDWVQAIVPIAAPGRHSAWSIGLSEAQRQAIYADLNWQQGFYPPNSPPAQGLAVARMMAMSIYRSWASFDQRFGRQQQPTNRGLEFAIATYLQHQGKKLVERFDANTYITLTQAMDSHDIAHNRGDYETVLSSIQQPALLVAINSDVLYPPVEQQELAALMPHAELAWLHSPHGHDAFLMEADMKVLNTLVKGFRKPKLNGQAIAPAALLNSGMNH